MGKKEIKNNMFLGSKTHIVLLVLMIRIIQLDYFLIKVTAMENDAIGALENKIRISGWKIQGADDS